MIRFIIDITVTSIHSINAAQSFAISDDEKYYELKNNNPVPYPFTKCTLESIPEYFEVDYLKNFPVFHMTSANGYVINVILTLNDLMKCRKNISNDDPFRFLYFFLTFRSFHRIDDGAYSDFHDKLDKFHALIKMEKSVPFDKARDFLKSYELLNAIYCSIEGIENPTLQSIEISQYKQLKNEISFLVSNNFYSNTSKKNYLCSFLSAKSSDTGKILCLEDFYNNYYHAAITEKSNYMKLIQNIKYSAVVFTELANHISEFKFAGSANENRKKMMNHALFRLKNLIGLFIFRRLLILNILGPLEAIELTQLEIASLSQIFILSTGHDSTFKISDWHLDYFKGLANLIVSLNNNSIGLSQIRLSSSSFFSMNSIKDVSEFICILLSKSISNLEENLAKNASYGINLIMHFETILPLLENLYNILKKNHSSVPSESYANVGSLLKALLLKLPGLKCISLEKFERIYSIIPENFSAPGNYQSSYNDSNSFSSSFNNQKSGVNLDMNDESLTEKRDAFFNRSSKLKDNSNNDRNNGQEILEESSQTNNHILDRAKIFVRNNYKIFMVISLSILVFFFCKIFLFSKKKHSIYSQ